jgi:hypothetical protein
MPLQVQAKCLAGKECGRETSDDVVSIAALPGEGRAACRSLLRHSVIRARLRRARGALVSGSP